MPPDDPLPTLDGPSPVRRPENLGAEAGPPTFVAPATVGTPPPAAPSVGTAATDDLATLAPVPGPATSLHPPTALGAPAAEPPRRRETDSVSSVTPTHRPATVTPVSPASAGTSATDDFSTLAPPGKAAPLVPAAGTDELLTFGANPVPRSSADAAASPATLAPAAGPGTPVVRLNPASVLAAPMPDAAPQGPNYDAGSGSGGLISFSGNDLPHPTVPNAPARIGRFEIIKLLGEGGFGSVYLAEQKVPVRRKVALKVVKLGMDTAEVLQRFEAERQALALMDHPNVARVFDAGVTDRGQPFFAMEYVEGVPLNRYIDDNELSLEQRLTLFIDICRAVQHAHGKGLIHRDLKPGNIIVSTVDGRPAPKVIDFGIAKATGPSLSDTQFQTETGRLIGTPEYMSPEQCAGSVDIDIRTDVYALGVILYEMLTGQLPFDSKMLRAGGIDGITRIIREVEPQRPSAKVTALDLSKDPSAVERITRARRTDLRHLQRAIKGDLDWIVLRALDKDRNRRYETANGLALDVQRHLDNQPVEAGPPDFKYRFTKFAIRNKFALAAGSAIAASLVIGLILSTVLYFRAERARAETVIALNKEQVARRNDQIATSEAVKIANNVGNELDISNASRQFLISLFSSIDPAKSRGRDVSVREVVEGAIRDLDSGRLTSRPEVEIEMRSTLGNTLRVLGRGAEARGQLDRALDLARKLPSADDKLMLPLLNRAGLAARDAGDLATALARLEESMAVALRLHGENSLPFADATQNLALVHLDLRRLSDAERLLRRALDTFKALAPANDPRTAVVRNNLANCYHSNGDFASAEREYREALAVLETQSGLDHPATASAIRNLALVVYDDAMRDAPARIDQPRLATAEALLSRAVGIWKQVLPPNHPDYRQVLDLRGDALRDLGKFAEAEAVIRESLMIRENFVGPDSVESLEALANLGNLAQRREDYAAGLKISADLLARAARTLKPAASPDDARLVASYLSLHGTLLLDSGRAAEAEPFVRRAFDYREKLFGVGDWPRANARSLLGATLTEQGKYREAEPLLFEAYEVLRVAPQTPPATVERARARLRKLYEKTGRPEEAAKLK